MVVSQVVPLVPVDDIVDNDRMRIILNIGVAKISLLHGGLLVIEPGMAAQSAAAVVVDDVVDHRPGRSPALKDVRMTGQCVVDGRHVLNGEAIDERCDRGALWEIDHGIRFGAAG